MRRLLIGVLAVLLLGGFDGETRYRVPPKDVLDIVEATPPPTTLISPTRDRLLIVEPETYPPLAALAEPVLRLGGIKVSPKSGNRQRLTGYRALSVQALESGEARRIALPPGARIGAPAWSPDGQRFAFLRFTPTGAELWIGDARTATARALPALRLTDVLGSPFQWIGDGRRLMARTIEAGRGAPPPTPATPLSPNVEEVAGKRSQLPTYQDLLKTPHDEALLEHYGRSQLMIVDAASGAATKYGAPGLIAGTSLSPDGRFHLVTRMKRPFSFAVPLTSFARSIEVWDAKGGLVATIADLPVADEVPRQGVATGARHVHWQPLVPARLVWMEALDGGDPTRKVDHRDKLMTSEAPFSAPPREVMRLTHRYDGIDWLDKTGTMLIAEYDRDRRWVTTRLVDFDKPEGAKVVIDRSVNDAYGDPGSPVYETKAPGVQVVATDGNAIFLSGNGASADGDRPFLDRLDLDTLRATRLFQSEPKVFERFAAFRAGTREAIVTRRETTNEAPNTFTLDLKSGARRQVTAYKDPVPQFRRVKRELVKYTRADGVGLSGTLYLPPDHTPGTRLPVLVWAYPLEFSDAGTAGQVRGSQDRFSLPSANSPVLLALKGYAVLMDATMPVVGEPETVNNTFIEQITANAKAAIDRLDEMGVADRRRVLVGGHSYGAFMTANLLAHTDLFVAGIARSGAYNRTLTPFGFQGERRSYWEATDLYTKVSPFTWANKINEPLLLVHGEADNNPGTFPIQSDRLFQAIRGLGGTARLVKLPFEGHGYLARESVLHVLAEMIDWADRWTKPKAEVPNR